MKVLHALTLASFGTLAAAQPAPQFVSGPVTREGFVGFVAADRVAAQPFVRMPGVAVRELSADPQTGRRALLAQFPAGFALETRPRFAQSLEIVVVEGGLRLGPHSLGARDFAFVPPDAPMPRLASATATRALLFFDPPVSDAAALADQQQQGVQVTFFDRVPWTESTLSRDAGADLPFKLKFLRRDARTGARTWFVQLPAGVEVPWERHSVAEEGFLLEGDYRLNECLPGGTLTGDYAPGGYFLRAGAIPHSGPGSGTRNGALWLQRSRAALDVEFFAKCEQGRPLDPIPRK